MNYGNQEEIDAFATKVITLRKRAEKTKSRAVKRQYKELQDQFVAKFRYLVLNRIGKYRKFSNYPDLEQDGLEALVLALRTYNPEKGSFTWWADKYISTRVARAANTHSVIRFPLKKAREIKPYKIATIPTIVDTQPTAQQNIEQTETATRVGAALKTLSPEHQKLLTLIYGLQGVKPQPMGNVQTTLSLSRSQCLKMLEEAKTQLRAILPQDLL